MLQRIREGWRAAPAALLWVALACSGETRGRLDGEVLLGQAVYTTNEEAASVPLADVRSIYVWSPDSLIVLDGVGPFLRIYGAEGILKTVLADEGEGPGELERAGLMAHVGDQFWILHRKGISIWDEKTLAETGRLVALTGTVAMFEGCQKRPTVLYQGVSSDSSRAIAYGVAVYEGKEWIDRSQLQRNVLSPTWPDFRVTQISDSTFVFFDWEKSILRLVDCDGRVIRSAAVPYPEGWKATPRPHGITAIDGQVVLFYSDRPMRTQDTTWVVVWHSLRPEGEITDARLMEGDWRLLGSGSGGVWLLDNRSVPTVFSASVDDFLEWLGLVPHHERPS